MKRIEKFDEFLIKESIDIDFKNKIIRSLNSLLGGYGRMPKKIRDLIKFDQIPIHIYQKINDYYDFERSLPGDTYIEYSSKKFRNTTKAISDRFLSILGFIELIGVSNFDRYNTIDLYSRMITEIESLPDIKNSTDVIGDYNTFRKIMSRKDSPSKDLGLVLISRFRDEYNYYRKMIG
jgi:hypothetical protein